VGVPCDQPVGRVIDTPCRVTVVASVEEETAGTDPWPAVEDDVAAGAEQAASSAHATAPNPTSTARDRFAITTL
jgi:hypothetical protein